MTMSVWSSGMIPALGEEVPSSNLGTDHLCTMCCLLSRLSETFAVFWRTHAQDEQCMTQHRRSNVLISVYARPADGKKWYIGKGELWVAAQQTMQANSGLQVAAAAD